MIDRSLPPPTPGHNGPGITTPGRQVSAFLEWIPSGAHPGGGTSAAGVASSGAASAHMLASGADSMSLIPRIELQVRDVHGTVELVALPWRLSASGQLGQLAGKVEGPIAATVIPPGTLGALSADRSAGHAASGAAPAVYSVLPNGSVDGMAIALSMRPLDATSSDPRVRTSAAATNVAAAPLAARFMRWIEQHEHLSSVWVRDYRLDEAGVQTLIQAVRHLAAENGLQLERIVINARQVWPPPSSTSGTEGIPCP